MKPPPIGFCDICGEAVWEDMDHECAEAWKSGDRAQLDANGLDLGVAPQPKEDTP